MNTIVRSVLTGSDGLARGVSYIDRYTFQEGEAYARIVVRVKIGISGANFAIAETGSVCVVESEGTGACVSRFLRY